ncbi:MAG: 50S ribosomal protein L9 [Parachlamydiaceae bacterium]
MANSLLLIEDVEDLGRSGDLVKVRPGFARNFLLPRGLAVVASKSALRMQVRLKEEREKKAAVDKQEAEKFASEIDGVTLTTVVKVDHAGHMYGSVNAHDIAELLLATANITVEKRAISLKHPIKETGTHKITVKLNEGVTATVVLNIVSDQEPVAVVAEQPPTPTAS